MSVEKPIAPDGADAASEAAYLAAIGERVREARARRGMTRKILARDSGVSERYVAQLESGKGNISILLLRQIARALDMPIEDLAPEGEEPSTDAQHAIALVRRLSHADQQRARQLLTENFGAASAANRNQKIALIGLRGAGKTTLGALLAKRLGYPFVELDKEIEEEAKAPLAAIFDLYGQPAFRRLERRCLDRAIARHPRAVIATGGGIVSDPATFERLLSQCYTIWLRAAPSDHMERVIAQGDMRPMADNREAMADLRRILKGRDALYSKADAHVDTSGRTILESLDSVVAALEKTAI